MSACIEGGWVWRAGAGVDATATTSEPIKRAEDRITWQMDLSCGGCVDGGDVGIRLLLGG